jgi:hypothetical protein
MAWQDVRGWYEEQDDDPPDPAPVELVPCPVCGTPCPADGETCGRRECEDKLDAWRRKGLEDAYRELGGEG